MSTGTPERPDRPDPYVIEVVLAAALARVTDAQTAAITQAWARAWSEVATDLLESVETVLTDTGRLNAMAVVRHERLARTLASIADVLEDLSGMAGITITDDLDEVLALADRGTRELIAAGLIRDRGYTLDLRPVAPDALTAIVRRTTEQVTSTTLPLAEETYSTILRELTRGVAAGDNPRETAQRMVDRSENLWNFGAHRATTIARTETIDAYREAARASEDANAGVLAGWVWLAHLGPRTCRACLAMHGNLFTLPEPGPYGHQNCRCSRAPVVKTPSGDPSMDWIPDAVDFLMELPVADQKAILGRDGWRAWMAGEFPPELWVKKRRNPGWRPSYVPAVPGD